MLKVATTRSGSAVWAGAAIALASAAIKAMPRGINKDMGKLLRLLN